MTKTNESTDKTATIVGKLKTQVRKLVQSADFELTELLDIWTKLKIKELRDRSPGLTEEQAHEMVKLLLEQGKMAEAIPLLPFMRDRSDVGNGKAASNNKSTGDDKSATNSNKAQTADTNGKAKTTKTKTSV